MHITFEQLREWDACEEGYKKLAKGLGGTTKYGKSKPVPMSRVLEIAGAEDALWCVGNMELTPDQERDFRLFAADCAQDVLYIFERDYPNDMRPRNAIQAARDYANGDIDTAAWAAARAAAWAAAWDAARDAARAAARAAARQKQADRLMVIFQIYEREEM